MTDVSKRKEVFPNNFLISISLLVGSIILAAFFPSSHRGLAAAAMFFSFLGDLALMDYQRLFSRYTPSPFVVGGVLFMISHVFYGFAFLRLASSFQIPYLNNGFAAALITGLLAYLSLILIGKKNEVLTSKRALLLALYAAFEVFDMTCVFSCGYGMMTDGRWLQGIVAPLGIVLFVISDYFIGMDKVAGNRRLIKYIWLFYPIGQLLLIIGA